MKKHIPNAITCCNLICGCIATGYAFVARGDYHAVLMAFSFIILGATFDFFDGFSARLLKVSSAIGKELDSLADVITFGFAPATLVYSMLLGVLPHEYGRCAAVAFIIAAFSALRLAKFNVDDRQSMGFLGLPTPANALAWGSVALTLTSHLGFVETHREVVLALLLVGIVLSCSLLVCEIPMFALKFHDFSWRNNILRYSFIIMSALLLIPFCLSGFAGVIALYVLISLVQYWRNSCK